MAANDTAALVVALSAQLSKFEPRHLRRTLSVNICDSSPDGHTCKADTEN